MANPILIEAPVGGVAVRLREPQKDGGPHILMLHGWSGDAKVMWVLESVLPAEAFLVAARGIHPLPMGGYHWSDSPASTQVGFNDFEPAVAALKTTLHALRSSHGFGRHPFLLMGFSQGAALSFAAARDGMGTAGIIALAGFVPYGDLQGFEDLPIFWGHGSHDELVPVERAREDVKRLLDAAAMVHFCEADVGHKLGIECTRGLKYWLRDRIGKEGKD
jgi:phospholipase/carboxylesterase